MEVLFPVMLGEAALLAGGSGYKDDVPTMMQGGEFVIKKSSAQKIGYGTLNAINGYAQGGPTFRVHLCGKWEL